MTTVTSVLHQTQPQQTKEQAWTEQRVDVKPLMGMQRQEATESQPLSPRSFRTLNPPLSPRSTISSPLSHAKTPRTATAEYDESASSTPFSQRSFRSGFSSSAESTYTAATTLSPTSPHHPDKETSPQPHSLPSSGLRLYDPNIRPSKQTHTTVRSPPLPKPTLFEGRDTAERPPPLPSDDGGFRFSKLASKMRSAFGKEKKRPKQLELEKISTGHWSDM